jgi:hypothetical protein
MGTTPSNYTNAYSKTMHLIDQNPRIKLPRTIPPNTPTVINRPEEIVVTTEKKIRKDNLMVALLATGAGATLTLGLLIPDPIPLPLTHDPVQEVSTPSPLSLAKGRTK